MEDAVKTATQKERITHRRALGESDARQFVISFVQSGESAFGIRARGAGSMAGESRAGAQRLLAARAGGPGMGLQVPDRPPLAAGAPGSCRHAGTGRDVRSGASSARHAGGAGTHAQFAG